VSEKLTEIVGQMAQQLGVATQYLWAALLKGAMAEAIYAGISTILCVVIIIATIKAFIWVKDRDGKENNFDEDFWFPAVLIIGSLTGVISVISFFVNLYNFCLALYAPEYFVVMHLLGKLAK